MMTLPLLLNFAVAVDHSTTTLHILKDNILVIHYDEGTVRHPGLGQRRNEAVVDITPLDTKRADMIDSYSVQIGDAGKPRRPIRLARKSKGTDFAWYVDSWVNGRTVNNRPDHTKEHWIYLTLGSKLSPGDKVVVKNPIFKSGKLSVVFNPATSRSEAVHVNLEGYRPDSQAKYGYLYHWAGSGGSIDFFSSSPRQFRLINVATGQSVYTGPVTFRKGKTNPETYSSGDTPDQNFNGADVYDCNFSNFTTPGEYRLAIDGVGCSFPFRIHADVFRNAFYHTTRALYHNRSGIELKAPYTTFTRPAPHNPQLTPGFAGKLKYTSVRIQDWGSESGDRARLEAGIRGDLSVSGWYQDAGDWDSYPSHLNVPRCLLLAYEAAPGNFRDGELNLPESGNQIPDIIDEAAWLPRFCRRLKNELQQKGWGTGGIGLRIAGDAFGEDGEGRGSWQDVDRIWVASGEDHSSTMRYAGAAGQLALALQRTGKPDPEGVNWQQEAVSAYDWAIAHTPPAEVEGAKNERAWAAAVLYRLTGQSRYENDLDAATAGMPEWTIGDIESTIGPIYYLMGSGGSPALRTRLLAIVRNTGLKLAVEWPEMRAMRWGTNMYMPMLVGHQTTPYVVEAIGAYAILKQSEPVLAQQILNGIQTSADYVLGTNSLNMTWVTGVGERSPTAIFHMDAWVNGKAVNGVHRFHPGLIPYSPWRKGQDVGQGPWDQDWGNPTAYPSVDVWPGNERWWSNVNSPMGSEFTIHQNTCTAAAVFGFLCGSAAGT